MKKNKKLLIIFIGISLILFLNLISAQFSGGSAGTFGSSTVSSAPSSSGSSFTGGGNFYGGASSSFGGAVYGASMNPQFTNPSFFMGPGFVSPDVYWPKFNREDCLERQDFIMQIAPGGCTPAVVRSDLLEEQNVPVFCKVMSIQVNPLIDISRIRSLTFRGQYPKGVSGISYFPARAALRSQQSLISSPVNDNLGYVVIVLSRQNSEKEMPEFLEGTITAMVDYDVENAFGTGNTNFYISEMNEEEWLRDYKQYGFWNGKSYIRAEIIEQDRATISIYRDFDSRQNSVTLKKGETSQNLYLSGFYCAAGMNIRLDNIDAPVDSALLRINNQEMWVARGDRIMNKKCTVLNLDASAGGGKISISCPIKNGKIDLSLNPGKANLNYGEGFKQYFVGDKIKPTENVYLGYVGKDFQGRSFAVLIDDPYSFSLNEFNDKNVFASVESTISKKRKEITDKTLQEEIKKAIKNEYKRKLANLGRKAVEDKINIEIITEASPGFGISLGEVLTAKDREWDLTKEEEKTAKEYYDWAIKYYEDLIALYPTEKMIAGSQEESYAAMGLYESAQLSRKFEMNEKASEYYDRLVRDYPDSDVAQQTIREKELFIKYDSSNSKAMVNVNGEAFFVEVLDFRKPTRTEAGAILLIDGKEETFGLDEIKTIYDRNETAKSLQIKEIKDDYVLVGYSRAGSSSSKTEKLGLNQQTEFEGIRVKLLDINLKKQARISITPKAYGPRSETNFSFKIGIEKRAIKLSPKKTKEMIDSLEKNMKEWNDINSKLGKVVEGLKGACFATSAVLTVKNLFSGWSGESMARQQIMTKSGGWNEFCEKEVNEKRYTNIQKCLLEHNSEINKDIQIYKDEIEKTNKIMEQIQKGIGVERTDILDLEGQVDSRKVEDEFKKRFDEFCKNSKGEIKIQDMYNTTVSMGKGGVCDWETLTHEQRRELMTLFSASETAKAGGSTVLQDMIGKELGRVGSDAKNYWENEGARRKNEEERKKNNMGIRAIIPQGDKVSFGDIKTITKGDSSHNVYGKYNVGENVVLIDVPFKESFGGHAFTAIPEVAGKQITVPVKREPSGDYILDSNGIVYINDGTKVSQEGANSVKEYMGLKGLTRFRESNAKAYQNPMLSPEKLYVKYFEKAPYKGLPAEVPFDIENGWYVEMTYVLSGFGKPYDESGRVVNFWICNVGPNGMIDFKKSLDDICRYYNGETGASLGFSMEPTEERNLIMRAQQAIYQAANQYKKERVVIGRNTFKSGIAFGGEEGRCSDFMSPADCNILFNVCDPVMCPASRCDLGGDFRVDNVVQTGVIGSLMLCLPNAKEGILMPVCLSGVHAGIEGYISIMNSTVQCLNESLTTGRNIGICDEIKSIYLCEFFWKQATPLINVIIPRIVESLYSQGVRGGGEYLTVQNAWDNMKGAIDYFRNDYAVNSMIAFRARSTEEIGGEICKSFMSVRYPNSKDFFDRLLEPDSPVQYHAWFSEDSLTTATVPSTSHYKVYYHIYSGKDQGAYYIVYLKDLPESNYIYSSQMYTVESGYVSKGSQVDQAKDFTAVSGYKQLCVNINGKDECGFGKVSSSYFINSLTDEYAAEQIKTGIKSEKECVAGTPSILSMTQPNLQAGAEEVIEPAVYNKGIMRVCATENPGKRVLPSGEFDNTNSTFDRWKEVGYCDDPTIKCWLDTSSVKDVIKNKGIEEDVLKKVDLSILGEIDYWTEEKSMATAAEMQKAIERLQISPGESKSQIENKISAIVKQLTDLTNLGTNNKYRARALYLLGNLYRKISENLYVKEILKIEPVTPTTIPAVPSPPTKEEFEKWKDFYRFDDKGHHLIVYNLDTKKEEEMTIKNFDRQTGKVTLMDNSLKQAIIEGTTKKRVVLKEFKGSSKPVEEKIVWVDSMLNENEDITVQIYNKITGSTVSETIYRYVSGRGWISKNENFNKMKLDYVNGIKYLVKLTSAGDKIIVKKQEISNKLLESDETMSERIFNVLKKENDFYGV